MPTLSTYHSCLVVWIGNFQSKNTCQIFHLKYLKTSWESGEPKAKPNKPIHQSSHQLK